MAFALPVLAVVAVVASVAGGLVAAQGAQQAAAAQNASAQYNSEAALYQAQVARNNATIADNNAKYSVEAGEVKATTQELATRALIGNQAAAQASSGLDINSGSAVEVRSSTAALGQQSALTIRNNAAREAYGYTVQGSNFRAQSDLDVGQSGLDKMQGSAALAAGRTAAVGDILGGVSKGASLASSFAQSGAFNGGSAPNIVS